MPEGMEVGSQVCLSYSIGLTQNFVIIGIDTATMDLYRSNVTNITVVRFVENSILENLFYFIFLLM
jgi:hypothetical protein